MRKLLSASLYTLLVLLSNIIPSCNDDKEVKFEEKTYEELYEELQNTTIELEVLKEGKRNIFYYSNNENIYIFTIKYDNGPEFGYIYDRENQTIYNLERQNVTIQFEGTLATDYFEKIFKASNFLLYLSLDYEKFEYIDTTTIVNRKCYQYRYETKTKNGSEVSNFFIDKETSLCLKYIFSIDGETKLYIETKRFTSGSNIDCYKQLIDAYQKEQSKPNSEK